MKNKYFGKIDGIRGIAVLLVFFYHSGIKTFNGGYIGVDIFFLISGFIITHTILRDKKNKSFSFIRFVEKRFRRILPVLFITILISLLIGLFIFNDEELITLADSSLFNLIFLSNFYYDEFKGEYFSTSSLFLPLIHTWSISIEIQFYFISFFIFYLLVFKKNQLLFLILLTFLSIIIAQLSGNLKFEYPYFENELLLFNQSRYGSFFQPFGRFWEFSLGSILAIITFNKKIEFTNIIFLEIIGIFIIVISFILFKQINNVPNITLVLPLLATILLILSSLNENANYGILNQFFLRFLGTISYSIFLIHQPLYVYLRYLIPLNLSNLILPLTIILTIFLSILSWAIIEKPFREKRKIKTSSFCIIILFLTLSIVIISLLIKEKIINFDNYNKIKIHYDNVMFSQNKHKLERDKYFKKYKEKNNTKVDKNHKNVLIIGDSLAEGLFIALNENSERFHDVSFHHLDLNRDFIYFSDNMDFEDPKYDFLNNNVLFNYSDYILITKRFTQNDLYYLPYFLNFIKYKNKKIIITDYRQYFFGYFEDPLFYILKDQRFKDEKIYKRKKIESILYNLLEDPPVHINNQLEYFAQKYEAKFIKYSDINCNYKLKKCFALTTKGNNIYFAQNHYTFKGAKFIGNIIYDKDWLQLN